EGSGEEQKEVAGIGLGAGLHSGQAERPPARQQQEPGTDRTVEARQPQVGPRPGGCEAIDPVSGRVGDPARAVGHRTSRLPSGVSNVPRRFVGVVESGTSGVVPSASLRLGALGRGPCAAISQMFLPISEALACCALTCLGTSAGTPQVVAPSSSPLIILASAAR